MFGLSALKSIDLLTSSDGSLPFYTIRESLCAHHDSACTCNLLTVPTGDWCKLKYIMMDDLLLK